MKIYIVLFISLITKVTFAQSIAFEQIAPLPPAPTNIANFNGVYSGHTAFADVDNDNDLDVIIIGTNSSNHQSAELYLNDGIRNFNIANDTPFVGVYLGTIAFADVDNDNDLDVLINGRTRSSGTSVDITNLYTNDGNGNFTLVTGTPFYWCSWELCLRR